MNLRPFFVDSSVIMIRRWPWTFYEVAVKVFFYEYIFSFCCCYFIFPPRKIDKKNARRIHSEFVSRGDTAGYLYSLIALGVLWIYTRSFARITWRFTLHSEYVFQVHSEKKKSRVNKYACGMKTKIGFYGWAVLYGWKFSCLANAMSILSTTYHFTESLFPKPFGLLHPYLFPLQWYLPMMFA